MFVAGIEIFFGFVVGALILWVLAGIVGLISDFVQSDWSDWWSAHKGLACAFGAVLAYLFIMFTLVKRG